MRDRLLDTMKLRTCSIVLELGASDGKVLHKIKRDYGISLGIGIDISSASVKRAKQNDKLGNFFLVADAHALPFLSHSLDLVLAFDVFEHLENLEIVLVDLHRCLKPGGKVLIHVPVSGGNHLRGMLLGKLAKLLSHPNWHKPEAVGNYPENIRTKDELIRLLSVKGFTMSSSYDTSVLFQPLYDYILISFLKDLWEHVFIWHFAGSDTGEGDKRLSKDRIEFQVKKKISKTKNLMLATTPLLLLILAVDRVLCRLGVKGGAVFISAEKKE